MVHPADVLNPADGYADGTTPTIIANERTERGRFVIVDIPSGERPPAIQLLAAGVDPEATDIADEFTLTPPVTSAFSF